MLLNLQVILRDFLKEEVIALTQGKKKRKTLNEGKKQSKTNKIQNQKIKKAREKINEIKRKKYLICFFLAISKQLVSFTVHNRYNHFFVFILIKNIYACHSMFSVLILQNSSD